MKKVWVRYIIYEFKCLKVCMCKFLDTHKVFMSNVYFHIEKAKLHYSNLELLQVIVLNP